MPTDTASQLRQLFRKHGMEPKEVEFNESRAEWFVSVAFEGSDERFHESKGEIGAAGAVDKSLDFSAVRAMQSTLDGSDIGAGVVSVEGMSDEYFVLDLD